jgi:hypothetical protein
MKTAYIDVYGYWGIAICYDYDVSNPEDEHTLWGYMRSFGMKERSINKALNILSNYNTGMCVSNNDVRMSGIFISKATNPSEWWSSCLHELRHAAQAIIDYYGADWNEDDAYLTGFLAKRAVEILGEPCR